MQTEHKRNTTQTRALRPSPSRLTAVPAFPVILSTLESSTSGATRIRTVCPVMTIHACVADTGSSFTRLDTVTVARRVTLVSEVSWNTTGAAVAGVTSAFLFIAMFITG